MIVSPWSQLHETDQLALAPKLLGVRESLLATDQLLEAAAERFDQFVLEFHLSGEINHQATEENLLTAQNFVAQVDSQSAIWNQIVEIKGFRRSYLELTVFDRDEFLRVLVESDYVINLEPFWTIHKFDSARETTEYSHHPPLHFANDRANESDYGPNYFFVHWDNKSPWFRKSNWPLYWLPGVRLVEQLFASFQHRFGCACPRAVRDHLKNGKPL